MAKDEQTPSKDWRLEEGGDVDDRWVLQDSEQQLNDQWDIEGVDEPVSQWQPVEYEKQGRSRFTWVLPTVVTVALLGVLGYSAFALVPSLIEQVQELTAGMRSAETPLEQTPAPDETIAAAEETPEDAAGLMPEEPTPAPAIEEPTPEPPPPTPSPTPSVVEQRFATVISAYGVNARREPRTDAEIIRILEQGETFLVYGEEQSDGENWLQLLVTDAPLTDGQPVSGEVGYAAADFLAQGVQPISRELYEQALLAGGFAPAPEEAAPAEDAVATQPAEESAEMTPAPGVTLPTVTPAPGLPEGQPAEVSITVDAPSGLNARTLPDLTSDVVRLLLDQETVPAISRLANNEWILADLGDGAQGWVSAAFVIVNGDINDLPVTAPGELPQPTPTPAETPTPETAAIAAPAAEPPAPYSSQLPAGVPGASVVSAEGVNARQSPSTDSAVLAILPQYAALPVTGRSADGEWLLVELPQGGTAWAFRSAIIPIGDVNSVPVSDAAGSAAPQPAAEAAPEETAAPAAPAATPEEAATSDEASGTIRLIVAAIFSAPDEASESIQRVGRGAVLPVTGRTADGQWIQVQSASGATGWVAAAAIDLNVDVETLAIIG